MATKTKSVSAFFKIYWLTKKECWNKEKIESGKAQLSFIEMPLRNDKIKIQDWKSYY